MSEQPIIFADALQEANIVHGVARLRLGQISAGGKLAPSGTLILPLQQLAGLTKALNSLVDQLQARERGAAPNTNPDGSVGIENSF